MKCMHCGAEWTTGKDITVLGKCPFCGKTLTVTVAGGKELTMKNVLRHMVEVYGTDILSDQKKCIAIFKDIAPDLKNEHQILSAALTSGVGEYFTSCPVAERESNIKKAIHSMAYLSSDAKSLVVTSLVDALGWDEALVTKCFQKKNEEEINNISVFKETGHKIKPTAVTTDSNQFNSGSNYTNTGSSYSSIVTPSVTHNQTVTKNDSSTNTKLIIIIIVITILAIAGASFYFLNNNDSESLSAISQNNKPDVAAQRMTEEVKKEQIKNYPSMVDGVPLLSLDDKKKVLTFLQKVEKKHGIRCAVLTVKSTQGMDIKSYADAVQDKYYSDAEIGSILMVINMDDRRWHITTDYRMRKIITDNMVMGDLKNAFIGDLSRGNYAQAFLEYGKKVDQLMDQRLQKQ